MTVAGWEEERSGQQPTRREKRHYQQVCVGKHLHDNNPSRAELEQRGQGSWQARRTCAVAPHGHACFNAQNHSNTNM